MPMGGWTTYCPPYAAPRRMRRAVEPTACRSMPGVSDRPEKRFRYSAVAPGAVPLSGGGIDTLRRVVKPINASCAGRARVDASRDKELPEHAKDVGTQDVALCEVQILTRSNLPPRSCRRRGWPQREETHGGIFPRRLSNKRSGLGRRAEKGGATLLPCPEST